MVRWLLRRMTMIKYRVGDKVIADGEIAGSVERMDTDGRVYGVRLPDRENLEWYDFDDLELVVEDKPVSDEFTPKFKDGDKVRILSAWRGVAEVVGSIGTIWNNGSNTPFVRLQHSPKFGEWLTGYIERGGGMYFSEWRLELVSNDPPQHGGLRFNEGKVPLSYFPKAGVELGALAFQLNSAKYGKHNHEKGMNWSIPIDCMYRHITALAEGEWLDESGIPHLGNILANAGMLANYYAKGLGTNDVIDRGRAVNKWPDIKEKYEEYLKEYEGRRSETEPPIMEID
jgi:hypothetical protein